MIDWLTLSQTAGTGNATITISASSYTELLERSASLRIQGTSKFATVSVIQRYNADFRVSPTQVTGIDYTGGTLSLSVVSDGSWTVTSKPAWVSLSEMSGGSGTTVVVATVSSNSGSERGGNIVFESMGLERTVSVSQVAESTTPIPINISPASVSIPSSGGSQDIIVYCEGEWSLIIPSFLSASTLSGSGNTTVTITASGNTGGPLAGYITGATSTNTSVVSVTQGGYYIIPSATCTPSVFSLSYESGTTSGVVESNVPWYVEASPWLSIAPSSGSVGNTTISITYGENTGSTRSGHIYIKNRNTNEILSTVAVSQSSSTPSPVEEYFTIIPDEDCGIMLEYPDIQARVNGGEWHKINFFEQVEDDEIYLYVQAGDVVEMRAHAIGRSTPAPHIVFADEIGQMFEWGEEPTFTARGNIMSLALWDSFIGATTLSGDYLFSDIFWETKITDAQDLVLPATALTECCYYRMFYGCESLTSVPELPATILADSCYGSMFYGCRSLTSAPALPATTLVENCYNSMFAGCISLTSAPILPAASYATGCYIRMFEYCTNLSYIKCLLEGTIPRYDDYYDGPTYSWVASVAASGTFVKSSNSSWSVGDYGIPSGWTVIDAT